MNQNLKDLLEKVSADEALRAKFEPIAKMEDRAAAAEAVLALAAEAGVPLAAADLEPDGELDLDELGAVTGGAGLVSNGKCGCFLYGQGNESDGRDGLCLCAAYGSGHGTEAGSGVSQERCMCAAYGTGYSEDD